MEDALSRAGLLRSKDFLSRFIVLMLLFVSLLLIGYAELSHRKFLDHHRELAAKATEGASRLIDLYLKGVRRDLALFAAEHHGLIRDLAIDSQDEEKRQRLQNKVSEYFPEHLAFTIANGDGNVLVNDFDGHIEEVCVKDIREFARTRRPQQVFIHPNPVGYHFDIMVRWGEEQGVSGIFFVSFLTDGLARILAESELSEHRMLVVHSEIQGLIELSAQGTRLKHSEDFILSPQQQERIIYTRAIPGTLWKLVDIPTVELLNAHRKGVRLQVLTVFVVFIAATFFMARLIRREEKGRSRAEEALLESHHQLEHRVQQRTRELNDKNLKLMLEIAERRKAQEALAASEQRYALAVNGSNDGIWDWNVSEGQIYLSQRCNTILGEKKPLSDDPMVLLRRVHDDERAAIKAIFEKVFKGASNQLHLELRMRHATGGYRWVLLRGVVVRDAQGRVTRMAGSLSDITKRKHAEEELVRDAMHDKLTGLPNRALFKDRLNQAIKSAARNRDYHFAVLYLDLDGFKRVNDSFGHTAGDSLLVEVTERIVALIRKEDTLARLSGDEFAVLLTKMNYPEDAKVLAQRILNQLAFPFLIEEREVYVSGSIGIAIDANHGEDIDNLLRDADIAMYRAKSKGKGTYELFDEQLRKDVVHRLNMETELRHALENNEIEVYFQPIVSLKSGLISGFEALARWQHPRLGLIQPGEFISIAEESKLILPLDTHVLREACLQLNDGRHRMDMVDPFFMSVNLSARQLLQDDLVERIETVLTEVKCAVQGLKLSLEITETAVMENLTRASEILFRLKEMGVSICVDDFGTGHSSLSYLQNLPINTLKIDRSLVSRMDQDGKSAEIVRTIISLARNLGLKVVAEGIENDTQLVKLRELQCDFGQGYLFSKPKGWGPVEELLNTQPTW